MSHRCYYCSEFFVHYSDLRLHFGKKHGNKVFIECHKSSRSRSHEKYMNNDHDQMPTTTTTMNGNTSMTAGNGKSAVTPPEQVNTNNEVPRRLSSKRTTSPTPKPWITFFPLPNVGQSSGVTTKSTSSSGATKSPAKLLPNRLPLSANTNIPDPAPIPEPIGDLIICTICRDPFYDPKYLAWHVQHEHTNDYSSNRLRAGSPLKNRSSNNPKKSPTRHRSADIRKPGAKRTTSLNSISLHQNQNSPGSARTSSSEYKCKLCLKIFSSRNKLKRHVLLHQGKKVLTCKLCPTRCVNIQQLREHQLKFHSDFYVFSISGSGTPSQLEGNSRGMKRSKEPVTTTNQKKPKLTETSENYSNSTSSSCSRIKTGTRHTSSGGTPVPAPAPAIYHCPFCSFTSASISEQALREHVRSKHGKGSPLVGTAKCKYCDYKVKYPIDLLKHIRSHEEEKIFSCQFCCKKFREYEPKMKHELKHEENDETFPCPDCDKFYFHPQSLTRHVAEFHPHRQA